MNPLSKQKVLSTSNGEVETERPKLLMRVAFQGEHGAYAEAAISEIWRVDSSEPK